MSKPLAEAVGKALQAQHMILATAESCTGGWVAKLITDIPGSSAWFERGFVTYTNTAKQEMLGVAANTLEQHGAVSLPTVREMTMGAIAHSHANAALAISGIAGPGGGSAEKPVGTVCFAWQIPGKELLSRSKHFDGDREAVRYQAAEYALQQLLELLQL